MIDNNIYLVRSHVFWLICSSINATFLFSELAPLWVCRRGQFRRKELATISEIDPTYENDLDNANLALQNDVEKAKNRIELHNRLIGKIDRELNELNQLKADR